MHLKKTVVALGLASLLAFPLAVRAQDQGPRHDKNASEDDDDDDGVIQDIERTIRGLPDRIGKALDELSKREGGEKARAIADRIEKTIRAAVDDLRGNKGDRVRVEVDGRKMDVPAKRGNARLY